VGAQDKCTLVCQQNAPCNIGKANFTDHQTAEGTTLTFLDQGSASNMHCVCPQTWTGLTCNRKFESCDGDHNCYNGGECIPGLKDSYGNDQLFCDCSHARDEHGYNYVGKYCEHQGMERCDIEGTFCVNGGVCNDAYPLDGNQCTCQSGYEGPHCEFLAGTVPPCDLECNAGKCALGIMYPNQIHDLAHLFSSENFKRCVCPPDFGGPACDIDLNKCGDNHCYYGAQCVAKELDGEPFSYCDCLTAGDGTSSYAGRFCQFEADTFCNKVDTQNGVLFCVNGGTCKTDSSEVYQGCDCPVGYYGPSCEFQQVNATVLVIDSNDDQFKENDDDDAIAVFVADPDADEDGIADYAECSLVCEYNGTCRKGEKDLGLLTDIAAEVSYLNVTSDLNFEYCVCPDGFIGNRCEYHVEICKAGSHLCLHGGQCVTVGNEISCNCTSAETSFSANFAGVSCEHEATDMCSIGTVTEGQPRFFCVNYGVCMKKVTATDDDNYNEPGCDCKGDWTGPHCELRISTAADMISGNHVPATIASISSSSSIDGGSIGQTSVLIVSIVAIIVSLSVVMAAITFHRRGCQKSFEPAVDDASITVSVVNRHPFRDPDEDAMSINLASVYPPYRDEPEVNIGPPKDEDGHELHIVEII